jgi:plastocyanin
MRKGVLIVSFIALATAGCGGDENGNGSGSGPPVSLAGATSDHGTKTASGTMEVELDDFYFEPTFIKAEAGQRITVMLHNEGQAPHTFTSTELGNVDEELPPGARKEITVTAPQSGQAVFFCQFHRGQGMQGAVFIG